MKVDLRCKNCGCGPEKHSVSRPGCLCGQCNKYVSSLTRVGMAMELLELAIMLAAISKEVEELRDFRRSHEEQEERRCCST